MTLTGPKAHQFQVATPGSTKPALWRDARPPPGPSLGIWRQQTPARAFQNGGYVLHLDLGGIRRWDEIFERCFQIVSIDCEVVGQRRGAAPTRGTPWLGD